MEIKVIKMDSKSLFFKREFEKYQKDFFYILSNSYPIFYGNDYHLKRIKEDKSILYLALDKTKVIGVSYLKNNLRRGGIAIYPTRYRRHGIGELLVKESLNDFPQQYSILRLENSPMISLLEKLGFKQACDVCEVAKVVSNEFLLLSNFGKQNGYILFNRKSIKRDSEREKLTLLHTFNL